MRLLYAIWLFLFTFQINNSDQLIIDDINDPINTNSVTSLINQQLRALPVDLENEQCNFENDNKNIQLKNKNSREDNENNLLNINICEAHQNNKITKKCRLQDILLMTSLLTQLTNGENKINSKISTKESNNLESVAHLYVNQTNNGTSIANNKKSFCSKLPFNETVFGDVQVVNASTLQKLLISNLNITSRSTAARCNLVYFFSNYCPFSAQGSAYVNALARSLINIPIYGLNSIEDHSVNTRYGVMGTPSLILFHNGNVVARYNASEYSTFFLESFIHHFTNQVIYSINVTSHDFKANLPSKIAQSTPYALYCAWLFLVMCGCCFFLNSEFYANLKEAVLNNWREAEAQHIHED